MHENVKFIDLIKSAKYHMEAQGFTDVSTFQYLRTWRSAYNYALSQGVEYFSAEFAEIYMRDKYNLSIGENSVDDSALSPYTVKNIRALRALVDFSLHGFIAKETRGEKILWSAGFSQICKEFLAEYEKKGYSPQTVRKHELYLCRFVSFLESRNVRRPEDISVDHIYDYFKTICYLSKPTLCNIRGTLVHALGFFHKYGICGKDLSGLVPKVNYYAQAKLSKVWSEEEISQILNSIDRANGTGKRDYAIIVIAANLGLRSGDIVKLSINNFDWKKGIINIVQGKTGEPLSLPLSEQIGKAVIDYWQNGRPNTVADELFVQHTLPYMGLSSPMTYRIFNKYFLSSGILIPPGKKHGLHSLRHSLASRLLEKDTPVNIVGNILGHVNSETAKHYIRVDVCKLRECGLEVPVIG